MYTKFLRLTSYLLFLKGERINKMKKAIRIITVIFIIIALLAGSAVMFCYYMDWESGRTKIPDNLSATATVQQYFEYWDGGNAAGMRALTADGSGVVNTSGEDTAPGGSGNSSDMTDKNYLPQLDLFCSIKCSDCVLLDEKAEEYRDYADNAIVSVNFEYSGSFGFGDENIPEKAEGWEFHLVKEFDDGIWKIISVKRMQ